jgi:hypothetical protein
VTVIGNSVGNSRSFPGRSLAELWLQSQPAKSPEKDLNSDILRCSSAEYKKSREASGEIVNYGKNGRMQALGRDD